MGKEVRHDIGELFRSQANQGFDENSKKPRVGNEEMMALEEIFFFPKNLNLIIYLL